MTIMGHDEFLKHQARARRIEPMVRPRNRRLQRATGIFGVTVALLTLTYMGGHLAVAAAKPAPAALIPAMLNVDAMPEARLIGFGCGAERKTLLRMEEDQFPTCEAIEPVSEACRIERSRNENGQWKEIRWETMTPTECQAFWGDGY